MHIYGVVNLEKCDESEYKFKAFLCTSSLKLRLQIVSFYDNGRPCEEQGGCYTHV